MLSISCLTQFKQYWLTRRLLMRPNIMLDRNISALPVVNDRDHLVGIMSHSNFFLHPIRDPGMHGTVFELFGKVVTEGNLDRLAEMLAQGTRFHSDVHSGRHHSRGHAH